MAQDDKYSITLESTGSTALSLLKRVMSDVKLKSVTRIRIEIESDEPFEMMDRQEGAEPEPEPSEEEDDGEVEPTLINGMAEQRVPHVGFDTDGYAIMEQLAEIDDFVDSPTIRQQSARFEEGESLSGTLWSLSDRGLVEKKDHPKDGRKKVYKLTSKGEAALEKAQSRSEQEA